VTAGIGADPHVADALRVVLTSSRPSRFKVLTVVCDHDAVLGRVYRTGVGLVLVHQTDGVKKQPAPMLLPTGDAVEVPPIEGPRGATVAYELQRDGRTDLELQSRCCSAMPHAAVLLDAVAAGRKRVRVATGKAHSA
jgi:hypothetical protein